MPDLPQEAVDWARRTVDDLVASSLSPDQSATDLSNRLTYAKNKVTADLFGSGLSANETGTRFSALMLEFAMTAGMLTRLGAARAGLGPAQFFTNFRTWQDQISSMTDLEKATALETLERQLRT